MTDERNERKFAMVDYDALAAWLKATGRIPHDMEIIGVTSDAEDVIMQRVRVWVQVPRPRPSDVMARLDLEFRDDD